MLTGSMLSPAASTRASRGLSALILAPRAPRLAAIVDRSGRHGGGQVTGQGLRARLAPHEAAFTLSVRPVPHADPIFVASQR